MTPATAPSPAPTMNVNAITLFTLIPIRPAIWGFSEVARIALPSRVRSACAVRPPIITMDVRMIAICTALMCAPPISNNGLATTCGNEIGARLQIIKATFCRMIEMPIAVIRGASRGAPRNGR
jgi:hypothetical protein